MNSTRLVTGKWVCLTDCHPLTPEKNILKLDFIHGHTQSCGRTSLVWGLFCAFPATHCGRRFLFSRCWEMGNTGKKTKHNINTYQHLYRLNVRCWKYPEKNCSCFPFNFLYMLHKVPMRSGSRIQWGPSWHQQVLSWSPSQGKMSCFCRSLVVGVNLS